MAGETVVLAVPHSAGLSQQVVEREIVKLIERTIVQDLFEVRALSTALATDAVATALGVLGDADCRLLADTLVDHARTMERIATQLRERLDARLQMIAADDARDTTLSLVSNG